MGLFFFCLDLVHLLWLLMTESLGMNETLNYNIEHNTISHSLGVAL